MEEKANDDYSCYYCSGSYVGGSELCCRFLVDRLRGAMLHTSACGPSARQQASGPDRPDALQSFQRSRRPPASKRAMRFQERIWRQTVS